MTGQKAMADPSNGAIADAFEELGDLYELDGAIVHRVVAYRNAARSVRDATAAVASLARAGQATELPGIGKTLQEKIVALVQTGSIPAAEKLRAKFPPGLVELTHLPGIGPKRARLLYDELGIDSLDSLPEAALAQRLLVVRGLGPKFEEQVLVSLEAGLGETRAVRVLLPRALEVGEQILDGLRERASPVAIALAGSVRRQADSVKDLDIVAAAERPGALVAALAELDLIAEVNAGAPEADADGSRQTAARARPHSGTAPDLPGV